MARGFDKLNVKSAVKSRNKFDLSRTHLTTMDFGQIVPLFCEETVPGDKFDVNATYFSRMAPLVKPTYGKFYFKTMEVFVPYYQICDGIDAWMAGRKNWEGSMTVSRWIKQRDLLAYLVMSAVSTEVSSTDVAAGSWYDFQYKNASGTVKYQKFTEKGRFYIKVLNSLGYVVPDNGSLQTSSGWYNGLGDSNLSALPLLAFAKGYNDWMSQSQRFNSSSLTKFLKDVKHNVTSTYDSNTAYNATNSMVTAYGISLIMSRLELCYENDYFTSAWQYPNAPISNEVYDPTMSGLAGISVPGFDNDEDNVLTTDNYDQYYRASDLSIAGPEEDDGSGEEDDGTGGLVASGAAGTLKISQRALDWLKSFDDWVRRNNYSGSRAVQQVYSRFGIKTEDYKSNYANLIDKNTIPVQVGDVTALAQDYVSDGSSSNIELGDYAGKGILSGNGSFSFDAKDYGMLFVFGWYTVDPMNVYGFDKAVLRNVPLDYYTPEFDGVGADPIPVGEVFVNPRETSTYNSDYTFGFTERYNSYRYGKDKITGDFRKMTLASTSNYATTGTEMNVWHTGRMLTDLRKSGNLVAQNPDFSVLKPTNSEYDRIFSITDGSVDHFYVTAQFRVSAVRPMLSLNQVPRLGEGDTVLPKNGNEIN